jgi:flagellar motor switch protein FliG
MRLRFASLVLCSRESLTKGLEAVAWDLLGFALLGTARDVQEHLLGCLDAPRRELVRVFMGHLTGIPEQEVTLAQKLILEYIGGAATE